MATEARNSAVPFRTDALDLGSYTPPAPTVSGKRRFSELPAQSASSVKEQPHTTYRDRPAERRSLYGSSSFGDHLSDLGVGDPNQDSALRKGGMDSMPFPPGVGGRGAGEVNSSAPSFEVITAEKAIDETNVGNRMLRNMGWQEGLTAFTKQWRGLQRLMVNGSGSEMILLFWGMHALKRQISSWSHHVCTRLMNVCFQIHKKSSLDV